MKQIVMLVVLLAWVELAAADGPVSPQSSRPGAQSDFPADGVAATGPATRASAVRETRIAPTLTEDQQIAGALARGTDFLLSQFRDGDLATAPQLSDSQRQGLAALCIYALAQTQRATSDPRLNPKSKEMATLLTHLDGYPLVSDEGKTNRPITYGRSLRAAALATFDRAEDRAVLKGDVAWLIAAQIDGAYSYDDLFVDLMRRGMKPRSSREGPAWDAPGGTRLPMAGDDARASVFLAQDFGGGSPDIGFGNPYPPSSPAAGGVVSPGTSAPRVTLTPAGPPAPPIVQGPGEIRPLASTPYKRMDPPKQFYSYTPQIPWVSVPTPPLRTSPGSSGHQENVAPGPMGPLSARPGGEAAPNLDLSIQFPWDNSNSQYGLLGVWAAAEVGIEVPDSYWQAVEKHWLSCELASGQWTYRKSDVHPTFAMTCAGVASLLVTHDYLDMPMLGGAVGREPYSKGLAAGLAWMDSGDNGVSAPNPESHYLGYDLFGLERVGLASGYKFLGSHDWYLEMSQKIVQAQFSNGAWGHEDHGVDTLVDTAYTMLFLSRGRHPVLMTKLKFDKYWDNRPRDVANLAKFATRQLERQVNWQVVGIEHTWDQWFDSPVVYIASHRAPKLADRDYNELRKFVMAGGLIFTHADASSANFDQWVESELVKRIAPGRTMVAIPDSDPVFSVHDKLQMHRKLMGVSNGVRWLLIHSPNDMGLAWQMRATSTRLQDFQLGLNVFLYAAGKPDLRNRIDSPFIPEPPAPPTRFIRVARLSYNGNWNPEPAAWGRLSRRMHRQNGEALTPIEISVEKLSLATAPIAALTGTGDHAFSNAQCDALSGYVRDGGVLLIDPCGGDNAFRLSIRDKLIGVAFAGAKARPLPAALATKMELRPFSAARLGRALPQIQLLALGKGYVVVSSLDLTNALLGTNTWGVDGYQPESALEFLKNLVHWSGRPQKDN